VLGSLCVLAAAVAALTACPGVAAATTFGFANSDYDTSQLGYQSYYDNPGFAIVRNDLGTGTGSTPGVKYERFNVSYDAFGSSDGKTCVQPSPAGSDQQNIIAALTDAESLAGGSQTPLIALNPDLYQLDTGGYASGETPVWPTDLDLICATFEMEQELLKANLIGTGKPVVQIEAMNEPDGYGTPGSSCEPGYGMNGGECAARYFADAVQGNAYNASGADGHVIAGAFKSSAVPAGGGGTPNTNCGHEGSFMEGYICYLEHGDGVNIPNAAPLQDYNSFAKSWSFHDYDDLKNSENTDCYTDAYDCAVATMNDFDFTLSDWGEPTNDMWVTEAAYYHQCGNNCYSNLTNTQELNAAEAWINIAGAEKSGSLLFQAPAHLFWYQYQTTSPNAPKRDFYDSALLDGTSVAGAARQSYCVLDGLALTACSGGPNN
jgi:hypothetical protein